MELLAFFYTLWIKRCIKLSGCSISFIHLIPVDYIPESINVISPFILIFKIICMFPDIQCQERSSLYIVEISIRGLSWFGVLPTARLLSLLRYNQAQPLPKRVLPAVTESLLEFFK